MITGLNEIVFHHGIGKTDFIKVTEMLAGSFWSPGIGIDEVRKGALNSTLVVGASINRTGQVAYARVISDKTRFAYILDVIVDYNYRGRGIGHGMIEYILSHEELKDVYQWLLITRDAHNLYSKSGFRQLGNPDFWMEIRMDRPSR